MRMRGRIVAVVGAVLAAVALVGGPAEAQQTIKIAAGCPSRVRSLQAGPGGRQRASSWPSRSGTRRAASSARRSRSRTPTTRAIRRSAWPRRRRSPADPAVVGAVWGITSVTCIPVSEVLDRVNDPRSAPAAPNPKVTDRGLKNTNRVCARDDAQGPAGAIFAIEELKAKKIADLRRRDDGAEGRRRRGREEAKAMGATALRYVIRAGDKDFRAVLGHPA